MRTMPLSEAKAHLSEVVESINTTHERVTLTKNGRNAVVMLAIEDWESMEATLELLADPESVRAVDEALLAVDLGAPGVSVDQVRAALAARVAAERQEAERKEVGRRAKGEPGAHALGA